MCKADLIVACSRYRFALACLSKRRLVELCRSKGITPTRVDVMIQGLVEHLTRELTDHPERIHEKDRSNVQIP